jgi:hypothetical protein
MDRDSFDGKIALVTGGALREVVRGAVPEA